MRAQQMMRAKTLIEAHFLSLLSPQWAQKLKTHRRASDPDAHAASKGVIEANLGLGQRDRRMPGRCL